MEGNERSSEMSSKRLSQRQNLLDELDADAIMDLLLSQGLIDPQVLDGLDDNATNVERNSTLLQHIEQFGSAAVTTLISALRQSWQLHLANSLDMDKRIRPTTGSSYSGKLRHKGELTIKIEAEALKGFVPQGDTQPMKTTETNLPLSTNQPIRHRPHPGESAVLMNQPTRIRPPPAEGVLARNNTFVLDFKDSLLGRGDIASPPTRDKADDDEEDVAQTRSCWCFCLSHKNFKSKKRVKDKKQIEARTMDSHKSQSAGTNTRHTLESNDKNSHVKPHRKKSKHTQKLNNVPRESKLYTTSTKFSSLNKDTEIMKKTSGKSKIVEKYAVDPTVINEAHEFRDQTEIYLRPSTDESHFLERQLGSGDKWSGSFETEGRHSSLYSETKSNNVQTFIGFQGSSVVVQQEERLKREVKGYSTAQYNPIQEVITLGNGEIEQTKYRVSPGKPVKRKDNQKIKLAEGQSQLESQEVGKVETDQIIQLNQGDNQEMICSKRWSNNNQIMHEKWASGCQKFQQKICRLCERIAQEARIDIIKYFEQGRGMLVWDILSKGSAIDVVSICMEKSQVNCLLQDISNGTLLEKLQEIFSENDFFDIQEVKFRIGVDNKEVLRVIDELS